MGCLKMFKLLNLKFLQADCIHKCFYFFCNFDIVQSEVAISKWFGRVIHKSKLGGLKTRQRKKKSLEDLQKPEDLLTEKLWCYDHFTAFRENGQNNKNTWKLQIWVIWNKWDGQFQQVLNMNITNIRAKATQSNILVIWTVCVKIGYAQHFFL